MSEDYQEALTEGTLQSFISDILDIYVKEDGQRELIFCTAEDVAIFLVEVDSNFEDREVEELLPFVKVWLEGC